MSVYDEPIWTEKYGPQVKALLAKLDATSVQVERDQIDFQIAELMERFHKEEKNA